MSSLVVFIVGPTAVGKSVAALEVAQRLDAEIISCDAMQVYKEIAIASDKPGQATCEGIAHHGIDLVSVTEDFDVARYQKAALFALDDIHCRGKNALIVGGSGLYMSILLDGIFEKSADDQALRGQLEEQALEQGPAVLHDRLKALDPASAAKIHPNDNQRVVRALEVVLSTGQPLSDLQKQRTGLWGKIPVSLWALNRPRQELYQRAEARIDEMFRRGLVEEIKAALELPLSRTARSVIGVPEVGGYLKGEYGLERAKYLMKLNTRHYIKRQLTWFRRDKRLQWVEVSGQTEQWVAEQIIKV